MNRRKFLSVASLSPVMGRQTVKKIAEEVVGKSQIAESLSILNQGYSYPSPPVGNFSEAQFKAALLFARKEIESLFYEEHKHVFRLDPDLANMKSFSLAAKIVYQRQRNVAHTIENYGGPSAWKRLVDVIKGVIHTQ